MNIGTARLALYTEKHDEEDLLAAYDIAQSVPMEAFSLSTARALALEPFLKILHSALCVHADNNLRSLEFAANVSSLILALCPAEDDTKVEFLRARILQLEKLVRECEENPSIVLNLLMEAIVLRRCILKLATRDEERLNWRLCLASLLWDYWQRSGKRHLDILHEEMGLRRDILQAHGDNDSDRSSACRSLAGSIYALYMSTGDLTLLDEVIMLEREVMNLCSEGDSGRDVSCGNLASSLLTRFNQTGETALLDEALKLQREALRLRPQGHPYRADSCEDLASALWTYFNQTGDTALLEEALELERDVLRLTPEGHPDRARSCGNLASSLWTCFNQRGDTALLDEALMLEREALRLRPEGHPARALTCGNLAVSLRTHFDQTGDTALLDEALELEREALGLRPEGHPDRADSCGNLASSLWGRFNQTGDTVLLDEALMLEREALRLMPEGQLGHARLCGSLASSLWTRFNQTGDTVLLDEALKLEREVLRLTPEGHLDRASSCGNLASSLWTRYVQTGDMVLLDEALELQREVLRLTVEGHPNRALRCGNLASSLKARFHQTGDTALLDETLELEREALRLMPEGHPDRASLLGNLAFSLRTRFDQTGDAALLDEALSLCTHALKKPTVSSSTHVLLRAHLADIHAIASYSSYSPSAAIEHLREAVQHRAGLMARFYHVNDVLRLWVGAVLSDEDNVRLLAVYQAVIEVLPELGNVVLDKASRLHRWRAAGNLPLEAFHHALKANNLPLGMELLEQGRAVLWSQTLAMQDPELQGLTDDWKIQLQTLLQSISFSAENGNSLDSELSARDGAHASYTRLQQLLKEIRASPGLERFMCVPSYPELLQVVSLHPVVILAPENKACHAIIISSSPASTVHLILDIIAISDLENLGHDMRGLDLNVRAMSASAVATEVRAMGVSGRREDPAVRKLHQALKKLWVGIVKPILDRLGLKVRTPTSTS
jgi:DNA-directed RNA polymerase subunit N (RpoN/RPB10)